MRKSKKHKTNAQKRSSAAKKGWKTRRANEELQARVWNYRHPAKITAPEQFSKGKGTGYRPYW
jgi:hypothetical protein